MDRKLFGTDGIRGRANSHPMTAEAALRIGMAAGSYFLSDGSNKHRVVIGKDTRRSGYMIENALTAGFTAAGMNVLLLGPVPTPAVGLLTRSMRAAGGVMISASHNPHFDNGIKFFGPDGYKLSDDAELEIEANLDAGPSLAAPAEIGRAKRIDDGLGRYVEFVKTTFPKRLRLSGLRIVVDCANGAAYRAAPDVLWELGADVVPVAVAPDGININDKCGSTDTRQAARKVGETRADAGICLDGDADRIAVIDEKGRAIEGDQLLGLFAMDWSKSGRLAKNTLAATEMSNLGLERALKAEGIGLKRTKVGDRYVSEAMRKHGLNLGGEQSGHIIMSDFTTAGDGLVAGLQFLAMLRASNRPASELGRVFEPLPQLQRNVRFNGSGRSVLSSAAVSKAIKKGRSSLEGKGRLIVRKSGTEPIIRIMAECEDTSILGEVVDRVASSVRGAA